jgi:hypothetical protein
MISALNELHSHVQSLFSKHAAESSSIKVNHATVNRFEGLIRRAFVHESYLMRFFFFFFLTTNGHRSYLRSTPPPYTEKKVPTEEPDDFQSLLSENDGDIDLLSRRDRASTSPFLPPSASTSVRPLLKHF